MKNVVFDDRLVDMSLTVSCSILLALCFHTCEATPSEYIETSTTGNSSGLEEPLGSFWLLILFNNDQNQDLFRLLIFHMCSISDCCTTSCWAVLLLGRNVVTWCLTILNTSHRQWKVTGGCGNVKCLTLQCQTVYISMTFWLNLLNPSVRNKVQIFT